ncbi:MAG TPA: Spy/CpxP family protein refolding chaperone [Gemmatimonadaceae bacterium]
MTKRSFTLAALGLALAAGFAAGPVAAQQPSARDTTARAEHRGRRGHGNALLRGIQLNDQQKQQLDSIRSRYRDQMRAMREQSGGDRQAMRGQMRDLMEKQGAEVRAILTPDQQKVFDQNLARMRERMREGGGRMRHGDRHDGGAPSDTAGGPDGSTR